MTGVVIGLVVLVVVLSIVKTAQDRRTARLDTAYHAGAAGTGEPPYPWGFAVSPAAPFATAVADLRELLADPRPVPALTRRSRPIAVIDTHVITLSAGEGAFLLIPTHEVRWLEVGLVPVPAIGAPRMVWGVTLTVARGEREVTIPLIPLNLYGRWSSRQEATDIGTQIHARLWPPQEEQTAVADAPATDATAETAGPAGLPAPTRPPRGIGAWGPLVALVPLIVLVQVVPIAIGNTRAIGWRTPQGAEITAGPAVFWWLVVLALLALAGALVWGWIVRLRWARTQP